MFVLAQFSLFDLRLLQESDSLITPLKGWPFIDEGSVFINNFGPIQKESNHLLSAKILAEDRYYVECKKSIKFDSLYTDSDPCRLSVNSRHIHFNGRGGVRFSIEFFIDLKEKNPFNSLSNLIQFLLQKRIKIKSPQKITKNTRLVNLTSSLKNLYASSTTVGGSYFTQKKMLRSQPLFLQILLSKEELFSFNKLGREKSLVEGVEFPFFYLEKRIANKRIDTFISLKSGNREKDLIRQYYLIKVNRLKKNLKSIIFLEKSGITLSPIAKGEQKSIYEQLFHQKMPNDWIPIYQVYKNYLDQNLSDLENGWTIQQPLIPREEIISYIRNNQLKEALKLLENGTQDNKNINQDVILLQARLEKIERENRNAIISLEHYQLERNKIVHSALSLSQNL